ncbi:hypothetical protein FACS189499_06220 [Clostridia bacterium]|nr:hypothetical protein FACS189499_06220 [Clostridia bacterium]
MPDASPSGFGGHQTFAADIVRDIFRMKLNGMAALRIAAALNERGVLSPARYKKDRGMPYVRKRFTVCPMQKF